MSNKKNSKGAVAGSATARDHRIHKRQVSKNKQAGVSNDLGLTPPLPQQSLSNGYILSGPLTSSGHVQSGQKMDNSQRPQEVSTSAGGLGLGSSFLETEQEEPGQPVQLSLHERSRIDSGQEGYGIPDTHLGASGEDGGNIDTLGWECTNLANRPTLIQACVMGHDATYHEKLITSPTLVDQPVCYNNCVGDTTTVTGKSTRTTNRAVNQDCTDINLNRGCRCFSISTWQPVRKKRYRSSSKANSAKSSACTT